MNMRKGSQQAKIFEKLLSGDETVVINNESTMMNKIRQMEKNFKPSSNDYKNLVLFWDDTVQFTTIGLLDLLLDHFDDIEDKKLDLDQFFYRGFENSNHITFVIKYFLDNFNKELTREFVEEFEKANYTKLLDLSPASNLFATFIRCEDVYRQITIVFRYPFATMKDFVQSIPQHFRKNARRDIIADSLEGKDANVFLKKHKKEYDIIMIQNIGEVFIYLDEAEQKHLSIVGPNGHNGVPEDVWEAFRYILYSKTVGPYGSEIILYNEGLSIC